MPATTHYGAMLAAAGNAARSFHDLLPEVVIDTSDLERVADTFRAAALPHVTVTDVLAAAANELRQRANLPAGSGQHTTPHTQPVNVVGAISYVLYGTVTPPEPTGHCARVSPADVLYRDTLTALTHHLGIPARPGAGTAEMAVAVSEWSWIDNPNRTAFILDAASRPRDAARELR